MRYLSIILPLLASTFLAASPLPDYPFVYVHAAADHEVTPDKASISFEILVHDVVAEKALQKQSEIADTVLTFASSLDIDLKHIVARTISKSAVRREDKDEQELEIIGYDTKRSVTIQLSTLEAFPKLIEFLYKQANIQNIDVQFDTKNKDGIQNRLTEEAGQAAKAKAEVLAKGFAMRLGKVRAISETDFRGLSGAFGLGGDKGYIAGASFAKLPQRDFRVIPETISFHKYVYAIFEIE